MYRPAICYLAAALLAPAATEPPKLSIQRSTLHQSEDGAPVPSDYPFLPGDTLYFSCQVAGYQKLEKAYDRWEIGIAYSVEARDPAGVLLAAPQSGKIEGEVSAEDKEWMPKVRFSLVVPPFAESGRYQIAVKAQDQNSKSEAEIKAAFTVQGRDVAASPTLVVRNFRFLRGEEDQEPLKVAAYRPGDMVWARFDMTGYKLGEQNRLDVDYGLAVLRPTGEVSYSQSSAAEEKTESFYPQRYTPGVLSLTLPKDVKPGEYTIVLTVRDRIGNQTFQTRERFSIE